MSSSPTGCPGLPGNGDRPSGVGPLRCGTRVLRVPLTYREGMPMTETPRSASPVDWEFAKAAGARLVPPGPKVSADEAAGVVASVRLAASRAQQPVADTARLHAPGTAPAPLVVDRPTWIGINADSMSAMVDPVFAEMVAKRKQPRRRRSPRWEARSPAARRGPCSPSWPARCWASTTSPRRGPHACCSSPRTSCTSSASSASTLRTSVSGSACTRRPTACSSPPCRGCVTT